MSKFEKIIKKTKYDWYFCWHLHHVFGGGIPKLQRITQYLTSFWQKHKILHDELSYLILKGLKGLMQVKGYLWVKKSTPILFAANQLSLVEKQPCKISGNFYM